MSEPSPQVERNLVVGARLVEVNEREGAEGVVRHFDEIFDPDFEWHPAVSGLGDDVYVGRDGFRAWLAEIRTVATTADFSDFELRSVGEDHLLLLCRLRLIGKESGLDLDSEYAMFVRMNKGRVIWGRAFLSHRDAEEAAAGA